MAANFSITTNSPTRDFTITQSGESRNFTINTGGGGSSVVTLTGTQTLTNKTLTDPIISGYRESVTSIGSSGATKTLVITSSTVQSVTMTAACTFTMPAATAGRSFTLHVIAGSNVLWVPTFTPTPEWIGGTEPTFNTTAAARNLYSFTAKPDGSGWIGSLAGAGGGGSGDVTLTGIQTLTNKTLALGSNTISGTKAQFQVSMTDDNFLTVAGTQTITGAISFGGGSSLTISPGSTFLVNGSGATFNVATGANITLGDPAAWRTAISAASKREYKSADFTAVAYGRYHTTSSTSLTVTNPSSGTVGDIFDIVIATGSAIINGVTYAASRFPVEVICTNATGPVWTTPAANVATTLTTAAISATTVTASGVIKAPNGVVGAPAYSFTAHPTSGFYDDTLGNIAVSIAGSRKFQLSSTTIQLVRDDGFILFGGSSDATLGRNTTGVLQVGTTASNASGSLLLTNLTASGTLAVTGAATVTGVINANKGIIFPTSSTGLASGAWWNNAGVLTIVP